MHGVLIAFLFRGASVVTEMGLEEGVPAWRLVLVLDGRRGGHHDFNCRASPRGDCISDVAASVLGIMKKYDFVFGVSRPSLLVGMRSAGRWISAPMMRPGLCGWSVCSLASSSQHHQPP